MTAKLLAEKDNPQADVVWGLAVTSLLPASVGARGIFDPRPTPPPGGYTGAGLAGYAAPRGYVERQATGFFRCR